MYENIFILGLVLFIVFCIISKKRFLQSLFFTIFFIIVLWINIPCFFNLSSLDPDDSFLTAIFKYSEDLGIFYTVFANVILGMLLLVQAYFTNKEKYTYNEIKKIYDNFSRDAMELYVIGRDLDFLFKEHFEKQTERITHLREKCSLLCESTTDNDLLELYKKVSEYGVQIKFYTKNDNITNLKGQIKTNQKGERKAIFTSKFDDKYHLLIIDNQFLILTILELCNKVYKKFEI